MQLIGTDPMKTKSCSGILFSYTPSHFETEIGCWNSAEVGNRTKKIKNCYSKQCSKHYVSNLPGDVAVGCGDGSAGSTMQQSSNTKQAN